jgi:tRNA(Arg) A34 adenosine deaminase TadA
VNQLNLTLPKWIDAFLAGYPEIIPDMEKQMRFVLELTERNIREKTGGPFGAAVFEQHSGKLVSVGVNVVVGQNCSAAHAEMMALMLAQKKLGHYDLGDARFPAHRLVTSGKMCAMCLGNVCWSGIKEVVSSAEPEDVESITGFDEGPIPPDYNVQLKRRGINLVPEVMRAQGKEVLQLYVDLDGQVYNATR